MLVSGTPCCCCWWCFIYIACSELYKLLWFVVAWLYIIVVYININKYILTSTTNKFYTTVITVKKNIKHFIYGEFIIFDIVAFFFDTNMTRENENVNKASTWRSGYVADKMMTDGGGNDDVINRVNSLRQTTRRHYVTLLITAAKQRDTHTCEYAHRLHNVNVCTKYTRIIIIIKKINVYKV